MTQLALIAALDRHGAIGRDNTLPWHLPEDLKRFKRLTMGHPVLMGRRTAESIGRALPGRRNFVLTRSGRAPYAGQTAVASIDEALARASDEIVFVIGGGEVYARALPSATLMHLTHVDTDVVDADAFFPPFDPADWRQTQRIEHPADARHAHAFAFVDYRRIQAPP